VFVPVFLLAQTGMTPASIAITHVTVIDTVNGSARSDMTVVIFGNGIITVADSSTIALPPDIREVDGRGKFLIPGLWDMHVGGHHCAT
jgi:imidazolonepropionase-like amidohydrolase